MSWVRTMPVVLFAADWNLLLGRGVSHCTPWAKYMSRILTIDYCYLMRVYFVLYMNVIIWYIYIWVTMEYLNICVSYILILCVCYVMWFNAILFTVRSCTRMRISTTETKKQAVTFQPSSSSPGIGYGSSGTSRCQHRATQMCQEGDPTTVPSIEPYRAMLNG